MKYNDIFSMPSRAKITARSSTVTNSFVISIVPFHHPEESEIKKCLKILEMDPQNLRCAYCGDKSTEWDHLRPLVLDKKPTGFISEIRNLVPACGKCNQSKGNKDWRKWIVSDAKKSPKTRKKKDLDRRTANLTSYEKWGKVTAINFEKKINPHIWKQYWDRLEQLHDEMKNCQKLADNISAQIAKGI